MSDEVIHKPVLLGEVMDLLAVRPQGAYIDGTLGGGGHAVAIVKALSAGGQFLGIDRDPEAIVRAASRLAGCAATVRLKKGNFADMKTLAESEGITAADGILLDLGVSSFQLDACERGFSFTRKGPLDMRMDPEEPGTAADLIQHAPESELIRVLREWGEEPRARRVAAAIVKRRGERPFRDTADLADVIARALGGRRGSRHPATRAFQAFRIAVNDELTAVEHGLEAALALLAPGGRLAVISFHSLEDRLVKHCFRRHAGRWESLAAGGRRWVGDAPVVKRITRKPVLPRPEEVAANPRARSAKLRVVERTTEPIA